MSIKTKIAALAITTLTAVGGMTASSQQAHAGGGYGLGLGIAAGVIGAAAFGSAIAAGPGYGYGYGYTHVHRRCFWTNQYDDYGYVVRVRTCNY